MQFRPIQLSDKECVRRLLSYSDYITTDYNFTVMYIWRHIIHTNLACYKDILLVRFADTSEGGGVHSLNISDNKTFNYLFPAGRWREEELIEAIEIIFKDAAEYQANAAFVCALPEQVEWLKNNKEKIEAIKSRTLSLLPMRGSFDYIYDANELISLKGKKFQAKRNFVNGFKRTFDWAFEPITQENIEECKEMNAQWYEINDSEADPSFIAEGKSVEQVFKHFSELECYGALLRVDGKVVGFTFGEMVNSNTLLIHIEKAFYNVRGAYQTLGNEFLKFVKSNFSDFNFVNREDDANNEGLRRAKMEYHPIYLAEKFYVKFE